MRIGIIGGTGSMGRWFEGFFRRQGLEVLVGGKARGIAPHRIAKEADVVILSVPLGETLKVIEEIGPLLRKEQLFMDFSSVKVLPVKAMVERSQAAVIGAHPLFGPRARLEEGLSLCLCPARGADNWVPKIRGIFEKGGLRVIISSPEEHDRAMALLQVVHHLSNLALGLQVLKAGGRKLFPLFTPSFRRRMELLESILGENPSLYGEMVRMNPYCQGALMEFSELLKELEQKALRGGLDEVFRPLRDSFLGEGQSKRIAYLGPEGTFSHALALKLKGEGGELLPMSSLKEVFRAAERGDADFALVPVENSQEGMVNETHDLLLETPLEIQGEVFLRVSYVLASKTEGLKGIRRVFSHPQALAQCRRWLGENLPWAEEVSVASTAQAALMALKEGGTAALVAEGTATYYGLQVLARGIEDSPQNTTRFFLLGRSPFPAPLKGRKGSICFLLPHVPGALHRALEPFAREGINLTRIVSRPLKGSSWEYVFFVDFEWGEDERVRRALEELKGKAAMVKLLGSYGVIE